MDSIRVMLVDDHAEFLAAAAATLGRDPKLKVVGTVSSATTAIAEAERLKPDLIILDWNMPEKTGPQALQALKQGTHSPRVVLLTIHDDPRYRAAAKLMGADGFVTKGEFETQLFPLIARLFSA